MAEKTQIENGELTKSDCEVIAADCLRYAADCLEELAEAGEPMGTRYSWRRAFNAAHSSNVDSPTKGGGDPTHGKRRSFDIVEDIYTEDALNMLLEHDINGEDAIEFIRNRANAIDHN